MVKSSVPQSKKRTWRLFLACLALWLAAPLSVRASAAGEAASPAQAQAAGRPEIFNLRTNLDGYPGRAVPRREKLELTFQARTMAENPFLPYDAAPPNGVTPGTGVTIDALFTPDGWTTVYRQPAFLFQEYQDEVRGGQEWLYPTGEPVWKVRFAPDAPGDWQYRLVIQDAQGRRQTDPEAFRVVESSQKGFIRVSRQDPRYFEYEDGTYFPALSFNMNYNHLSWDSPVLANESSLKAMGENGIQLVRLWLSQWGVYGAAWNPWFSIDPEQHDDYIPWTWLTFEQAYPGSDVSMQIGAAHNPCMFLGFTKAPPAVKRNTQYRVRIRYKTQGLGGPVDPSQPYGFTAKLGPWLWGEEGYCYEPGKGSVVSAYASTDTEGWTLLEGGFNSGDQDFLPYFYLVMENTKAGKAFVDRVWIEEDLGGGRYGPNLVSSPWMAHHLYVNQRNAYAFDRLLALAEQYGVTLRPVISEKNDWIFNHIDFQGRPAVEANNDYFYGDFRRMTKVRWLQQAWWRYLQARWGYSSSIHSWELLNEGDPFNGRHYALADEFGRYMRQFAPHNHLVSTSFWHSFPRNEFWASAEYPNVDFADIHRYYQPDEAAFGDTALATYDLSMQIGAGRPDGAGKPVIRGEVGFAGREGPTRLFNYDFQGIWLHNFIWGGINPGGLIESYWYEDRHIYGGGQGRPAFDHRPQYRAYYNFISSLPLNNGRYQDADPQVSGEGLRAWGQKDLTKGRAHLWVQNKRHTWRNLVNGAATTSVQGSVTLAGFRPGSSYRLEWWDPYQPDPDRQVLGSQVVAADEAGNLSITVSSLSTDIAVKVAPWLWTGQHPLLGTRSRR